MRLSNVLHINVWYSGFLDTPILGADWVVNVTHYILKKFFYFVAGLGYVLLVLIWKIYVFLVYYNFIWRTVYTIYLRDFHELSLTYEFYTWVHLLDSHLFLKFLAVPEDKDIVFPKHCIIHFIWSDYGK